MIVVGAGGIEGIEPVGFVAMLASSLAPLVQLFEVPVALVLGDQAELRGLQTFAEPAPLRLIIYFRLDSFMLG